ncbi:hypothetical protein FOE78_02250 [Microlunatus elymi]|uniref:CHRD domain-containing protein n=1 Tax=Microlunatus elymi TaxID=2596828 RepID=A0A516PUL6_9ACTN|nr:hypothetical protein [Microlunatus elymi]QDP94894.1 hypothetical protein FOE78_02250 [Microlunatus elymi]
MRHPITRRIAAAAALSVPLALAAGTAPASAQPVSGPLSVRLDPLKGSDASGTATLTPTGNGGLKVSIHDTGLVPNMPHAQHIHGDTSGKHFTCPTDAADKNGDGFISIEEGLPMYGNIHISLTTKGDTSMKSALAVDRMPVADANGDLNYQRTLKPSQLPPGTLSHLTDLHIVQHGVDANGNDKYDLKGLGESTFAKSAGLKGIPEEATDGATCGMIMPVGSVDTGGASTAGVDHPFVIGAGIAGLIAAGGLLVIRRRSTTSSNR